MPTPHCLAVMAQPSLAVARGRCDGMLPTIAADYSACIAH